MHNSLDVAETGGQGIQRYGKYGQTVLVVSGERVGRVFVVQALREHGLHTVISDNAQQAVRRLSSEQSRIAGIVIVGDLPDGTAESYQRWLRRQGHHTMPVIAVGTQVGDDDAFARSVDTREWLASCTEVLHSLGLVDRRRAPRTATAAVAASAAVAARAITTASVAAPAPTPAAAAVANPGSPAAPATAA